jgi:hypothetical protein
MLPPLSTANAAIDRRHRRCRLPLLLLLTATAAAAIAPSAAVDHRHPIILGRRLPPQSSIAIFVLLQLRVFRYLFSQKE